MDAGRREYRVCSRHRRRRIATLAAREASPSFRRRTARAMSGARRAVLAAALLLAMAAGGAVAAPQTPAQVLGPEASPALSTSTQPRTTSEPGLLTSARATALAGTVEAPAGLARRPSRRPHLGDPRHREEPLERRLHRREGARAGRGLRRRRDRRHHGDADRSAGRLADGARLQGRVRAGGHRAADLDPAARAVPDPAAAMAADRVVAHPRPRDARGLQRLAGVVQPGGDLHVGAPRLPAHGVPRGPPAVDRDPARPTTPQRRTRRTPCRSPTSGRAALAWRRGAPRGCSCA